ncbi:hypothetical protein AAEU31_18320 [Pseudoalteromonas sp. SSMSWG5]|uniref:hypothetical protein n=1 Tax=Pseudoalteromonas TaxID=53246 RepID=UPI000C6AD094|nr:MULTISPECIES: hypothetical protein [unclassified Pseudoalteromonas]MBU76158.1 hypothetical protein [Pseudoalteromonadaceae bacterium]TGV21761.1 hypothetical protein E5N72_12765 [Pseudoalteromonas sp. MEBiC 03607]TMO45131.1 hypothetical protein CWC25_07135 [Pseudoalteromonas sp. S4389]HCV04828.1 hypothetical protein [Pseudoalteromonas sp.]
MAIISCPQCAKSISDKHKQCPHCECQVTDLSNEQLQQMQKETRIRRQQKFMNQSFLALILFLGGFFCYYFMHPETESIEWYAYSTAMAVGFVWYIVCRIYLVVLKKKK